MSDLDDRDEGVQTQLLTPTHSLLDASELIIDENDLYTPRTYMSRWLILFIFSFSSFNQSLFWITFSPISDMSEKYFQISSAEVEFFLNYGGIIFVPFAIPLLWLTKHGLRKTVLVSVTLQLIACVIRCIPCFWPERFVKSHGGNGGIILIHLGQIVNAICGPMVMATPSMVSQTWFGDGERTTSTAVGSLANNFGSAAGFLMAPFLVRTPDLIPKLLYIHTILALIPFIMAFIYFPDRPPTPPSISAIKSQANEEIGDNRNKFDFLIDLKKGVFHRDLIIISLAGGFINGVFNGWSGIISDIVNPYGYSDTDAGWFGFASTIGTIVGGMLSGYVADKYFQKRFKNLLVIFLVFGSLFFMWFALSIPSPFWSEELLPQSFLTLLIAVTGAGFFLGCTNPLFIEFGVELTYPIPETASTVLITLCNNIGTMSFLFIPPEKNQVMTATMFIIVVITTIINMVAVIT
eukprot:c21450_g6_i6.p1 GENE.c21450_g6_i6~~c21450_g6_i6.p1  ORF type:complete len:464 (+),score=165.85 c21450_g6_i6:66-1457(+)